MYSIPCYVWCDDTDKYIKSTFFLDPKCVEGLVVKGTATRETSEGEIQVRTLEIFFTSNSSPDIFIDTHTDINTIVSDITRKKDYVFKLKGA